MLEHARLLVPRRSPRQRPHGFDRIGCRIAHSAGNRLVIEAVNVLHREFSRRNIGTDLFDHTVMIDQGFGNPAIERWLRQIA